jgi:hypothetical protein
MPIQVSEQSQTKWIYEKIDLSLVIESLYKLGYKSEQHGSLRGMSGANHFFDLVSRGNGTRLAIDFLNARSIEEAELAMIKSRAKFYDSAPDLGVLIFLKPIPDQLCELSKFYRFSAIQASNSEELCTRLFGQMKENDILENRDRALPFQAK